MTKQIGKKKNKKNQPLTSYLYRAIITPCTCARGKAIASVSVCHHKKCLIWRSRHHVEIKVSQQCQTCQKWYLILLLGAWQTSCVLQTVLFVCATSTVCIIPIIHVHIAMLQLDCWQCCVCVHVGYVLYRAPVVHFNQAYFISTEFVAIFSSPKLHPCQVHKVQRWFNCLASFSGHFQFLNIEKLGVVWGQG